MLIGTIIDNIWATRKDEKLSGLKLMVVAIEGEKKTIVAADYIGAGIGDRVIIVTGSSAKMINNTKTTVDATIVAIIDEPKTK